MMDHWTKRSHARHLVPVRLTPGRRVPIRLEYRETTGNGHVRLVWDAGVRDDDPARIREAVTAARRHDAVVVVAGIEEGEFRDRASLALPGRQEALIRAVAATGTPVTVVVVGGGAVTMPWLDAARAVLLAWYPGQAGGDAVADVLTGRASPAGRLPFTMPVSEGQLPLTYDHEPTGRGDDYVDLTGQPLFPFGHGLSYTTFAYDSLVVTPAEPAAAGPVTVRARVRNTGPRAGDEVVQLYLRRPVAPIAQPVLQLAAFARVALAPGEARTVAFTLDREALGIIGADGRRVPHAGPLRIYVGSSSRELALRATVTLR
jgi:beta-glucosidase